MGSWFINIDKKLLNSDPSLTLINVKTFGSVLASSRKRSKILVIINITIGVLERWTYCNL